MRQQRPGGVAPLNVLITDQRQHRRWWGGRFDKRPFVSEVANGRLFLKLQTAVCTCKNVVMTREITKHGFLIKYDCGLL